MLNVGILISGRGSNLQALISACSMPDCPARIVSVISNKADAKGIDYARAANIPTLVIPHRDYPDRRSFEIAINTALEYHEVQFVCLAGWMRILTPWFVERWRDRLINIHPSLLPAFPGVEVHIKVLDYGAKLTGCTIHFVRAGMDDGPVILQAAVPVLDGDTEKTLAARVLEAEHRAYPAALKMIAENRVNVFEERVFVAGSLASGEALFNPKG